jgi:cyanate permease
MNVGSPLAAIVSPLVFGFIIDKTNNWDLPFLGSAVVLLIGTVVAFWMRPNDAFRAAGTGQTAIVGESADR